MYCKKCDLEVHGGAQGICPICEGPLDEHPLVFSSSSGDSQNDQKLRDLITDIDASVKKSLEPADSSGESTINPHDFMMKAMHKAKADTSIQEPVISEQQETPFDLEKALSAEGIGLQKRDSASSQAAKKQGSDFTHTKDILDKALEEFETPSAPSPGLYQKPKSSALFQVVTVVLVVIIAGAAGYYFSFKEPEPGKNKVPMAKNIKKEPVKIAAVEKQVLDTKPRGENASVPADIKTAPPHKADTAPAAEPVEKPPAQLVSPPAQQEEKIPAAVKENQPAEQAPVAKPVESPPVHAAPAEKKVDTHPATEAASVSVFYCVNVGSFKLQESADSVIKELKKKGYDPSVDTVTVRDSTWYRLTIGKFNTPEEAQVFAKELEHRNNIKGFVVKKKQ